MDICAYFLMFHFRGYFPPHYFLFFSLSFPLLSPSLSLHPGCSIQSECRITPESHTHTTASDTGAGTLSPQCCCVVKSASHSCSLATKLAPKRSWMEQSCTFKHWLKSPVIQRLHLRCKPLPVTGVSPLLEVHFYTVAKTLGRSKAIRTEKCFDFFSF